MPIQTPVPEEHASTIQDFCKRWGISMPTFNRRRYEMPPTVRVGGRVLILKDDEEEWVRDLKAKARKERDSIIPTRRESGTYLGHVP